MKVLVAGIGILVAGSVWAAPKIEFDKVIYDFGKTSNVSAVTGTFTFHNAGDAELQVQKPAPSCGCTVAAVKPDKLPPGEKGELVFTVNVGHAKGVIQKSITVPSNDPASPSVHLSVRADIAQVFEVNPQTVVVGDITQGVITNYTVQVKRTDGEPLDLDHVLSTSSLVRATVEPATDAKKGEAVINVSVEGEGVPRRFNDRIQLFAKGANTPFYEIIVIGRLVGDVSVVPERLTWGIGNNDRLPASRLEAMLTRTIRLTATKPDLPVEINGPESTMPDMKLQLTAIEPGKVYMLTVKLPESPKESSQGTIKLHTNLASQPVVEVPFNIAVFPR